MPQKPGWYNKNAVRSWPFDDTASLADDSRRRLPSDIIADLRMRFPRALGERAFVGAVTLSPRLVSVTILSADTGAALAAASSARPVSLGRQIALTSQAEGVGGWIVFGDGADEHEGTWRFANPSQSLLLAQAALRHPSLPIPSLGKLFIEPALSGVVRLLGGSDVEVVAEEREIAGVVQDAIVIRLAEKDTGQADESLLSAYAGPCGGRPESRTCGEPEPIESINEVSPDCCGRIYLELRGCAEISRVSDPSGACGAIVDCGFGLSGACVSPARLPGPDGTLPNQYDDQCEEGYPEPPVTTTTPDPAESVIDFPVGANPGGLPYAEDFEDGPPSQLSVQQGEFAWRDGGLPPAPTGAVASVVDSASQPGKALLRTDGPHSLSVGDTVLVAGVSVANYNGSFVVLEVPSSAEAVLDVAYAVDALGGVWTLLGGAALTAGFGQVDLIAENVGGAGEARVETVEPHALIAGDRVAIAGNSQAAYSGLHDVNSVLTTRRFISSVSYTASGTGGLWALSQSGNSGGVASVLRDGGSDYVRVNFRSAHGLAAGESFVVSGSSQTAYNVVHRVQSVLTTTSVSTQVGYVADSQDGVWKKQANELGDGRVWQGSVAGRNLALWDLGAPALPTWQSWWRQVEATVSLRSGSPGSKRNAGLVINWRRSSTAANAFDWWLLELSWDGARALKLWEIRGSQWKLLSKVSLSGLGLGLRYRLSATVLPMNDQLTDGAAFGGVVGLDDGLEASLPPERLAGYAPATGNFGLHTHQSPAWFEDFTVRFISP